MLVNIHKQYMSIKIVYDVTLRAIRRKNPLERKGAVELK